MYTSICVGKRTAFVFYTKRKSHPHPPPSFYDFGPKLAHKIAFSVSKLKLYLLWMGTNKKNKRNKNKINKIIIKLSSLQPSDRELVKSWLPGPRMTQACKIGASNVENYLPPGKPLKNFHFVLLFTYISDNTQQFGNDVDISCSESIEGNDIFLEYCIKC
jgi:hypothetical protein